MDERMEEKNIESVKTDFLHLFESIGNSFLKKWEGIRDKGDKVAEDVKNKIETHPKTSILIAATTVFGLGVLASKLWDGRNRR